MGGFVRVQYPPPPRPPNIEKTGTSRSAQRGSKQASSKHKHKAQGGPFPFPLSVNADIDIRLCLSLSATLPSSLATRLPPDPYPDTVSLTSAPTSGWLHSSPNSPRQLLLVFQGHRCRCELVKRKLHLADSLVDCSDLVAPPREGFVMCLQLRDIACAGRDGRCSDRCRTSASLTMHTGDTPEVGMLWPQTSPCKHMSA